MGNKVYWILVRTIALLSVMGCSDDSNGDDPSGQLDATGGSGGSTIAGTVQTGGTTSVEINYTGGTGVEPGSGGTVAGDASSGPGEDAGTPSPSGGTLIDGECRAGGGPDRETLGNAAEILVETNELLFGPVAHQTGVYYSINNEGLYRIPPGSDSSELILATPDQRVTPWIIDDYIYYRVDQSPGSSVPEEIERLPLSDLTATPELVLTDPPREFTVDETHVYAYDNDAKEIFREPIGGGEREVMVTNVSAANLVIPGDGFLYYIYISIDDLIKRVPMAGGTPETIMGARAFDMDRFWVTDRGIYWLDYYALYFTSYESPNEKVTIHGGDTYVIGFTDERVYWNFDVFPKGYVGWTNFDLTDCDGILSGGQEFNNAVLGSDGVYVTTFGSVPDVLYRIPLDEVEI